ncbi:MAG: polyprenyl synthetase family protein [Hydrogenophilus sp.]|nr:polyprenyl synthetase family protein [Hydrogenophilus sp.]
MATPPLFDPSAFEATLAATLEAAAPLSGRLANAMRHALLAPGKRVRPQLVFAAGALTGAHPDALTPFAAAVELIHTYSLIHDDLPAIDNDDLRRGRPTVHIAYDEATAILAGDALQALAFETLAAAHALTPEQRLRLIALLARAAGAAGMVGGQALDIEAERHREDSLSFSVLEQLQRGKTGALIEAAILGGALCGRSLRRSHLVPLAQLAAALGLAFQITDDLLDATATSEQLGKRAGKDAARGKITSVTLLGIEGARHRLQQLRSEIEIHLKALHPRHSQPLALLVRTILDRTR